MGPDTGECLPWDQTLVNVYHWARDWWMFTIRPDTGECLPWDKTLWMFSMGQDIVDV